MTYKHTFKGLEENNKWFSQDKYVLFHFFPRGGPRIKRRYQFIKMIKESRDPKIRFRRISFYYKEVFNEYLKGHT